MIKVGDSVLFKEPYADEDPGSVYKVLEVNGDRCKIKYVCNLPIPPVYVVKTADLQVLPG
jgi:hypothetical protein